MTIFMQWRCHHDPTQPREQRYVATYRGRMLTAATMTTLQRKIEAAMDEQYA